MGEDKLLLVMTGWKGRKRKKKGKAAVAKITQETGNYFYLIAASLL